MSSDPRQTHQLKEINLSLKAIARTLAMIEGMASDFLDNKEDNIQLKHDFKELLASFAYEQVAPLPVRQSNNFIALLERYNLKHHP